MTQITVSDLPKQLKITYFFQVFHHLEGFSEVLYFKATAYSYYVYVESH